MVLAPLENLQISSAEATERRTQERTFLSTVEDTLGRGMGISDSPTSGRR